MKARDKRCGATWSGLRTEHCTRCHQTFSGSTTGDAHRVGAEHPQRCLSAEELTALGLWVETNAYGTEVWHGSPNKAGIQRRRPAVEEGGMSDREMCERCGKPIVQVHGEWRHKTYAKTGALCLHPSLERRTGGWGPLDRWYTQGIPRWGR